MTNFETVVRQAEQVTGLTYQEIKDYSPEQMREHLEKKNNSSFGFTSEFPVIGRGNVLHDKFISRAELDASIDKILK